MLLLRVNICARDEIDIGRGDRAGSRQHEFIADKSGDDNSIWVLQRLTLMKMKIVFSSCILMGFI